ncbi:MAG: ABC transporter ATP-binding protein [Ghiorsea sp.]
MQNIIEAKQLTKKFDHFIAVNGIDLTVGKGEIFGLLGPNAAGKSTTIRLLAGILATDGGSAKILDYDLHSELGKIKAHIGYVSQSFALYPELTVAENLDFYSAIYAVISQSRKKELLREYGLEYLANKRAGILSGGYKRRLSIACALAHDPELIFLDEPTSGIDPVTRKELWEKFYMLATQGKALFITTHYMEEAERCHKLAFLNHGQIVAEGSPASMISEFNNHKVYTCPIRHDPNIAKILLAHTGVKVLNQFGETLRIITNNDVTAQDLAEMIHQYYPLSIRVLSTEPTIEDVFITLTNEESTS